MDYDKVCVYRPNGVKKSGLYVKVKAIALVILAILVVIVVLSTIFVSKTVYLEGAEYFGVYNGVYASQNTAEYYAKVVRMRGGAGGVYKDGNGFMVFLAVYEKKSDALAVQSNLVEEGENALLYTFETRKTKLKFGEGNRIVLTEIADLVNSQLKKMLRIAVGFDDNDMNGSDVIIELTQAMAECDKAIKTLQKTKDKDEISSLLEGFFNARKTAFKQITADNVVRSAELKTTYFDLLVKTMDLYENLS